MAINSIGGVGLRPGVCTSTTRPTAPYLGQVIFETDTAQMRYWDGTVWNNALGAPVGSVQTYAGSSAPTGWLLCAGQAISRATYSDLFTVLSTTYGAGNGSTTFNLPDLRGRTVFGKDDMGGSAASRLTSGNSGITATTLGAAGGDERIHQHSHANTAAFTGSAGTTGGMNANNPHSHTLQGSTGGSAGLSVSVTDNNAGNFATYLGSGSRANNTDIAHGHSFTPTGTVTMTNANSGAGTAQNVPPAIILNYIIKA